MIDIHCHILPGLDDGSQHLTDSIAMARAAVEEGITKIVATPHHQNGTYDNQKDEIVDHTERLNKELDALHIPLTIIPGQEVRIHGELLQGIENDEILPIHGTSCLLIEFPSGHVPRYAEKMLFDLQLKGITPIIVHPERNREINENPDLLYTFVKKGALTQVTAASLTGQFGKKIRNFSLDLVEAQLTHFIASDAHNTTSRGFQLLNGINVLEKEFGSQAAYYYRENAELLISGQTVFAKEPSRIKKKKFLGIF
ncbi:tyrosine protein phosphatase [Bacillus mangrovi]|uniref:Tyrosine-protein phosphatase n=1 Tax=Metabacillus mangrovi TaxID=1491830 RepID=A0A7X2S6V6_9BACI|nr:tyrosine protein phosphatase [Metabacillus mangrovi]